MKHTKEVYEKCRTQPAFDYRWGSVTVHTRNVSKYKGFAIVVRTNKSYLVIKMKRESKNEKNRIRS